MKNDYIIINKNIILQRINDLDKEIRRLKRNGDRNYIAIQELLKENFQEILDSSIPLTEEIEESYNVGFYLGIEETYDTNEKKMKKNKTTF